MTAQDIEVKLLSHQVVLFMKGYPENSPCGFSTRLHKILDHLGVRYEVVDVLASAEMRSGIKAYSGVRTLPQLFVNGRYIGGSDDVRDLYERNELQQVLRDFGVTFNPPKGARKLEFEPVSREEVIACAMAGKPVIREASS